jgi:ACS family tartrate transporter-like MFS transporter
MLEAERSAIRKIRLRILLPVMLLIVLSSLDRVNISFAALQMNAQLGLTPQLYGFAVGIFFIGYLIFQFPSTAILARVGAKRWITGSIVAWGAIAICMSLVRNAEQLYVLRFLLGSAESGFAPGIVYYVSGWMPRRYRAGAVAISMLAVPIAVVIGGPLCGWLMSGENLLGMSGWRWMFLMEGAATVVFGLAASLVFVDHPQAARWLTPVEKEWVSSERASESETTVSREAGSLRVVFADARVWIASGMWCAMLVGANGMIFWLPQAIKQMSVLSDLAAGTVATLPWIGVGAGMLVNAWHSDLKQERFWHLGIPLVIAAGALVAASATVAGGVALLLLFLSGFALGSAQGVFWAVPTTFLRRSTAASGITLINLIGNLGSLAGPYAIGWIRSQSHSFAAPVWFVAAVLVGGALLVLPLRRRC